MIERDWENLSAYIDDAMTPTERSAFEVRLAQDPALRATLDDLRQNARLLAELPKVKAPRNFTLDPAVYGRRSRGFAWWSLRAASALGAAASFVLVVGLALMLTATVAVPAGAPARDLVAAQPTLTRTLPQPSAATAEPDAERMADQASAHTLAPLTPTLAAPHGTDALGTEAAFMAQEAPDAFPDEMQPVMPAQPQVETGQEGRGLGGMAENDAPPPEMGGSPGEAAAFATEKEAAGVNEEAEAGTLLAMPTAPAPQPNVTATPVMAGAVFPITTATPAAVSAASATRITVTVPPTSTPPPSPTAPSQATARPAGGERVPPGLAVDPGPVLLAVGAVMLAAAGALAAAGLVSRRR